MIANSNSMYAFYGSLRRGMMYYDVYKNGLEYQFSSKLSGFKLYALKDYPIAIKTNHIEDSITVEIFKIIDSQTEKDIHELELSVGYYYDEVTIKSITAGIYLFNHPENYPQVKSGDWVQFFGSR
ncbi:MAG: gamma-glutamylcyclotransferase [Bacteroidia bacterium]|nr:gamma-glutamylcyclotransferase [Bacteroidia bacterium]